MRRHILNINKNLFKRTYICRILYLHGLNYYTHRYWTVWPTPPSRCVRHKDSKRRAEAVRCPIAATDVSFDVAQLPFYCRLILLFGRNFPKPNIRLNGQIYHIKSLQWIFGWPIHITECVSWAIKEEKCFHHILRPRTGNWTALIREHWINTQNTRPLNVCKRNKIHS